MTTNKSSIESLRDGLVRIAEAVQGEDALEPDFQAQSAALDELEERRAGDGAEEILASQRDEAIARAEKAEAERKDYEVVIARVASVAMGCGWKGPDDSLLSDFLRDHADALRAEIAEMKADIEAKEEALLAVLPEDVGAVEYITVLRAERDALAARVVALKKAVASWGAWRRRNPGFDRPRPHVDKDRAWMLQTMTTEKPDED